MSCPTFIYRDPHSNTEYRWEGGEYIDVGYVVRKPFTHSEKVGKFEDGEFRALSNINVWNYDKDEPQIPRTRRAFIRMCEKHLRGE